jgi:hypothetical protein
MAPIRRDEAGGGWRPLQFVLMFPDQHIQTLIERAYEAYVTSGGFLPAQTGE